MSFQAYLDAVEDKTRCGHGMALVHVIKNGPKISAKHVGRGGVHADDSDTLWLDGKATKPTENP